MKIRSFPRPPRGSLTARPGAVEPVIPESNLTEWTGVPLRRRKKDKSVKRRRETFLRTIAIGILALMGLGGIAFVGLSRDRAARETVWHDPDTGFYTPKTQAVMPLTEDGALDLVRKVLAARSPEQLSDLARLKDMSAVEAIDFLTGLEQNDGKVSRMDWIGNMDSNQIQIEGVEIAFEKDSVRPRRALLTPNEKGVWQVDLAALAARNSEPWEKVISEPRVQADLRVVIARDNYYNGRFSDEHEWSAYGMASPDSDAMIVGYCPRDSETDRVLMTLLKESRGVRAIIRVRKTDLPASRQCEIISALAEDWILTGTPLEDRHSIGR